DHAQDQPAPVPGAVRGGGIGHGGSPLLSLPGGAIAPAQAALLLLQEPVREDDLDDGLNRVLACTVALQLDRERDPADRLRADLRHAVKASAVGLGRSAADRVN